MTDLEMTKLLAVKVMGREALELPETADPLSERLAEQLQGERRWWFADRHEVGSVGAGLLVYPWRPLALVSHAWEVLEAILKRSPSRPAALFLSEMSDAGWFQPAPETARAICIAALKAVGVEV